MTPLDTPPRPEPLTFAAVAPEELPQAQTLYRGIIDHLGRTVDYPHWHSENHPAPAAIEAWANAGELFVARDGAGEAAGVVVLNHEHPPDYGAAAWAVDASGEEILVIHALGVVPKFHRRGVAWFLVEAALEQARVRGCRTVRLDTYVRNTPALELYRRYGFTDLGVHTVRHEGARVDQFHLFEYVL